MKTAIVAHFDPASSWEDNFIELLQVLGEIVESIVVVTTAIGIPDLPSDRTNAILVRRPNFGYDFYSYRVGIRLALTQPQASGIFILNSSFLLLDSHRFRSLLEEMSAPSRSTCVRGLTASLQFGWHIQSYLIYFDLRHLDISWVQNHFEKIEPLNTKFEVVLQYEIGLGRALKVDCIDVETMFQPNLLETVAGSLSYMWSLKRSQGWDVLLTAGFWRAWQNINWTHFGAIDLARRFGVVKSEFIRSNPHNLNQNAVWAACEPRLRQQISDSIERSRQFYLPSRSGMTELIIQNEPLDIILKTVTSLSHRLVNAKIAVVLHLFYVDLFDEILDQLINIVEPFDLYITTPFEADVPQILAASERRCIGVKILLCRNKGRDVGPFLALYRTGYLDNYHAVLKLHSKKSSYSLIGDDWRRELFAPLCGNSMTVLQSLRLIRENGCGVIGPSRYFLTNQKFWGANRRRLATILATCSVSSKFEQLELAFFAGTMFWFAPHALSAIYRAHGETVAFEAETGLQDGTLAHAWERAFCLLARDAGFGVSSVALAGRNIFSVDTSQNQVPVLEESK
jgi:lipopolysaccharide biosynthesis protein